jgi:indolepyruvate ferredoxin oxidoreductase beta subunit
MNTTLTPLKKDPYNIIITGVGGQGNVLASRVLGSMFVNKGYKVTIGETFNASQRGGTVMSHLRISEKTVWSPQIPRFKADLIVSLEPVEAVRVLAGYGNPSVRFLSNIHPIYPVSVIKGETTYPTLPDLEAAVRNLVPGALFINATEGAVKLGNAILANIIMLGAIQGLNILPMNPEDFRTAISARVPAGKVEINMAAYDLGSSLAKG